MMVRLIHSELLKMRHTFAVKLCIAAPAVTLGLGYFLSGGSVQLAAYNWWYFLILPVTAAVWGAGFIGCEKRTRYQNILCLSVDMRKLWLGKTLAAAALLLSANLVMWCGGTVFGVFTVMNIDPLNGFLGCMLLFLAYIWQLPFIMWLAGKINELAAVLIPFGCSILSAAGAEGDLFYLNPFAIPARIVCPFFKMHPNGLPVEKGSSLLHTGAVIPAVFLSLILAVLCFLLTAVLFARGDRND